MLCHVTLDYAVPRELVGWWDVLVPAHLLSPAFSTQQLGDTALDPKP